jgi:GT2 family glycosyltransferase
VLVSERWPTRVGTVVEAAALLADDIVLVLTRGPISGARRPHLSLRGEPLETRWMELTPRALHEPGLGALAAGRLPEPAGAEEALDAVEIRTLGEEPQPVRGLQTDLKTLIRRGLAGLDADDRQRVLAFLCTLHDDSRSSERALHLSRALHQVRMGLRERLPPSVDVPGEPQVLHVSDLVAIDERSFYVHGWACDGDEPNPLLCVVSPEGARSELAPDLCAIEGGRLAFACFFELDSPSYLENGWTFELRSALGAAVEADAPPVTRDVVAGRDVVLADLADYNRRNDEFMEEHVHPALRRLSDQSQRSLSVDQVLEFGAAQTRPTVSLIVPARGGFDLVEQQLVLFAQDPELESVDLVYVVDPSGADASFLETGKQLHRLYRLAFRVAVLNRGGGFGLAAHAGASLARAHLLGFLHSDTIPDTPGWLGRMVGFYESTPMIGALGAKLLYEDETIQHAGLAFSPQSQSRWQVVDEFKGLHRSVPAANEPRRVAAVTGACLMISRDLYDAAGGFDGRFVTGAFEAADLCLRLIEAGRENWYVPAAELYHLEGQAQAHARNGQAETYDAWLSSRRWDKLLYQLVEEKTAVRVLDLREPHRSRDGALSLGPGSARSAADASDDGAPLVEILDVEAVEQSGDVNAVLEAPTIGTVESAYAVIVTGSVVAQHTPAHAVEISADDTHSWRVPINVTRNGAALAGAEATEIATSGFQTAIGALRLRPSFELTVDALLEDETRVPIATVRGRRRLLRSSFQPTLQPLMVTTLGRTGSSWLMLLLSRHPEIVAYLPFQNEPRVLSYWLEVLKTLAEPASYFQTIRPQLYRGHWWIGSERPSPLPVGKDRRMEQWLGREGVVGLAALCQDRIDAFYREAAATRVQHGSYFAEKVFPDASTLTLAWELYPEAREIVLVRDFRDMACSIFGYNAKRGFASFGREHATSDEEFVRSQRESALRILANWQERRDRAYLLRYEDLIVRPTETLGALLSYLDIASDGATIETMLQEASGFQPDVQRKHQTSDDPVASVGRWQRDLDEALKAVAWEAMGDVLVQFGYAEDA